MSARRDSPPRGYRRDRSSSPRRATGGDRGPSRAEPARGLPYGDRDGGRDRSDREPGEYRRGDGGGRGGRGGYSGGGGGYGRDERVSWRDRESGRGGYDRADRGDYRGERVDREHGAGGRDYHDRDGGRGGGYGRDSGRDTRDPREAPRGQYGRRDDRPPVLDRRAIEEGRRRREEERAMGVRYAADGTKIVPEAERKEEEEEEDKGPDEDLDDETAAMAKMMGFGGFGTTKGTEVEGNEDVGGAKVNKKRTWRQYMNRRGGFNRALDKMK